MPTSIISSLDRARVSVPLLVISLLCMMIGLEVPAQAELYKRKLNVLAINGLATEEYVDVELTPPRDLDFMTRVEVFKLRSEAVKKYPQLLVGDYRPSKQVFGQIVDRLPWWGILGIYHYGSGKLSIEGPSEHSQSILNPFLLVVPMLHSRWDKSAFTRIGAEKWDLPLYCMPRYLRWLPKGGKAWAKFDVERFLKNRTPYVSLIVFNARDLSLPYIRLSLADSLNITKKNASGKPFKNPQFIHAGGSCGYPGNCNNVSPRTPPIDAIRVTGVPFRIVVHFWESRPLADDQQPDMVFTLYFE